MHESDVSRSGGDGGLTRTKPTVQSHSIYIYAIEFLNRLDRGVMRTENYIFIGWGSRKFQFLGGGKKIMPDVAHRHRHFGLPRYTTARGGSRISGDTGGKRCAASKRTMLFFCIV